MGLWKAREASSRPPSLSSQILSVTDTQRLTEKHCWGQNCTKQGFFAIVDNVNNCNANEAYDTSFSTLHVQHTFLYISLPLFCTTTTWNSARNFLVTRFMEEKLYVFLFFFFSLPLIFTLVAASSASISHFLTAAITTKLVSFVPYLSL